MDKADKDFLNPERVLKAWKASRLGMYVSGVGTLILGGLVLASLFPFWVFVVISSFTVPVFLVTFFIWWILLEYPAIESYSNPEGGEPDRYSF